LVLVGLWTPGASLVGVMLESLFALAGLRYRLVHMLMASVGLALALIGPGAWSLDARLYGRRRLL
jgi:hypothetical protein